MRKLSFVMCTLTILFFCSISDVFAATPLYQFVVSNETLTWNTSNSTTTASFSSKSETDYSEGTLTLNNYDGGQIKLECYGSGQNIKFFINLVGDNKISVPGGIGIISSNDIEFIGDGTLTIVSSLPIGEESMISGLNNYVTWTTKIVSLQRDLSNNINIVESNNSVNDNILDNNAANSDNSSNNEVKQENTIDSNMIILGIVSVLCIVSLIVAISSSMKLKNIK